jgi:hypothetical protein
MLDLTIYDAEYIIAALREKAERERADAEGKIHNAKISRLDAAGKLEGIAERVEAWQWSEQERQNERARPKHRPMRRVQQAG